ncbi:hypothetical protein D6774_03110 [Candidatus Woesearchaeota archaeon]|nr:MAG: hypothetical protein D6774_03110 [Candidatus Woesearchaeota archaeon]
MKSLRKAMKKISALGIGASMVGATILGATAQAYDLGDYPQPFVQDGKFNGLLVVGDDAAPADIIGITDIAIALQFSSTTTEVVNVGGTAGVSVQGDAVEISSSSDLLEINENIGDVRETVTGDDLEALASGTVSTDRGTTDYNQYIRFKEGSSIDAGAVQYTVTDNDEVGDFLLFQDGDVMFEYELEFEEGLESDVTSDNVLEDLEDETLNILGQQYAVVQAKSINSDQGVELTLLGGDVTDTLEEGQTKTYTIDGVDYEVTAVIIADSGNAGKDYVKLKVNGEITDKLAEGDTDKLSDGTEIGIRDVLANEAGETAGGDIVEFYLGASKLILKDNVLSSGFDGSLEASDENIEAVDVEISGNFGTNNDTITISSISFRVAADSADGDDIYIPAGESLRGFLDEPEALLSDTFDIRYEGLADTGVSVVKLNPQGDDEYRLVFENIAGAMYNVRLAELSGSNIVVGDAKTGDNEVLHWVESPAASPLNWTIDEDDSFVLASKNAQDENTFSYVYTFDSIDTDSKLVTFSDEATGSNKEVTYDPSTYKGELIVGGKTFDFYVNESTANSRAGLAIDLNADNDFAGDAVNITTKGGMIIGLPASESGSETASSLDIVFKTLATEFDGAGPVNKTGSEVSVDEEWNATIVIASGGNELDASVLPNNKNQFFEFNSHEEDDNLETGMTPYGALVSVVDDTNDAAKIEIEYPVSGQRGAQVFVTAGTVSTTAAGGAGTVTIEKPNRIDVGAALLASQVSSTDANIISVGGPCVNAISAQIMGLSYPACGDASGLGPNEAMIKLYESGDNVAIVVAGYDAEDTTAATRVLADYEAYQASGELAGKEVRLSVTNPSSFTVTPVNG